MTDERGTVEEGAEPEAKEDGSGSPEGEDKRPGDTLADQKTCPQCGAPVDDVRATCIDCGYEYGDEDHEDTEAGNEFMAGSQIDDEGNEIPEDPGEDDESQDSDDSSEDSDDSDDPGDSGDSGTPTEARS